MALADVKAYFKTFEKAHLERFAIKEQAKEAVKDGYITQEKADQLEATFKKYDETYQFFAHIMYLYSKPVRGRKKEKFKLANKEIEDHFSRFGLDEESIKLENEDVLVNFRKYIENFKNEVKQETKEIKGE